VPKQGYTRRQTQSKIAITFLLAMEKRLGIEIKHAGRGAEAFLGNAHVDGAYTDNRGRTHVIQVQ
jgi:hypothetical protein